MADRKFYIICSVFIIIMLSCTILGALYEKLDILFNILLTVLGTIAGFIINRFFAQKSERHNLGNLATSGYRLSIGVYEDLKDTLLLIERLKTDNELNNARLEIIAEKLKVIQRFAYSANLQWKDTLPENLSIDLNKITHVKTITSPNGKGGIEIIEETDEQF